MKDSASEQRKYIRLGSVFPVEIYLEEPQESSSRARLIQAFTNNVSLGGLCLSVNNPDPAFQSVIREKNTTFNINISMPLKGRPIEANVRVAWHEIKNKPALREFLIGVAYEKINPRDRQKIMNTARRIIWFPRAAVFFIICFVSLFSASFYRAGQLTEKNKALISRFYQIQETDELYKRDIALIDEKYAALNKELAEKKALIEDLNKKLSLLTLSPVQAGPGDKERLEGELKTAEADEAALVLGINRVITGKERMSDLSREASLSRRQIEEAAVKNMYQWFTTHQNKFTGLIMSFEGDPSINNWAFTYDQSLACQVFLISGDTERAKKILSFYRDKAKRNDRAYINAYNAESGSPVENIIYAGPNVWIGIAALQYTYKTGDKSYLGMAADIAKWTISLKDKEGGLKGGPGVSWYSTEHNLDAYALYEMLYDITGEAKYKAEKDQTLRWIKDNTYSMAGQGMKRGKGDATIATDTMAWAIAAIGPVRLREAGMDPSAIVKFAEDHCVVETFFLRPDGSRVKVTGFDFGKTVNTARGGVVSTEWTAQMVMAFKVMALFCSKIGENEKAETMREKAAFYLGQLDKMVISSPSRSGQGAGCLPYASQPAADTGHGWRTPQGRETGSVAGTAYTIFAKKGYNPLALE